LNAGAKLAPFDWGGGGGLLELPCKTDDALQQKGERGGGGGVEKNFSGQKKFNLKVKKRTYTSSIIGQKIFFVQIPVKTCMKPLFF
jgi:hypothetical protein